MCNDEVNHQQADELRSAGKQKYITPGQHICSESGEIKGRRRPQAESAEIPGQRLLTMILFEPVVQYLQARHIGSCERHARQKTKRHGAPEAIGEKRKTKRAHDAAKQSKKINPACVDHIRQTHKKRHRCDVAGEIDPSDPTRLRTRQRPLGT